MGSLRTISRQWLAWWRGRKRVKRVCHSGVFAGAITDVDHAGFRVQVYGTGWSANQWAGWALLVMFREPSERLCQRTPVDCVDLDCDVVSNDSRWLTLDRDPVDARIGDVAVVRFKAHQPRIDAAAASVRALSARLRLSNAKLKKSLEVKP